MVTTVLAATAASLAAIAVVLLALLLRRRGDVVPAPQPPPAVDAEALLRDLYAALERYGSTPLAAPAPPPAAEDTKSAPASAPREPTDELGQLLAHMLRAARAIPGADAALAVVTRSGEPVVATSGLSDEEAERLASTLPAVGSRTRSIAITYDYGEGHDPAPVGRIERGLAVPLSNLSSPGLLAILTRAPGATLGEPQLGMLEEICSKASSAYLALVDSPNAPAYAAGAQR